MSLPTNNKKDGKQGSKNQKSTVQNSKFIGSQNKGANPKKPIKTGGSRGS